MSPTYFNSLDPAYKTPFGAVAAGQAVTFRLTVPESLGYVDPHLVLTKDHEDPVHYRMEFAGQTPQQNHFTFTIAPGTPGLYFYHFDLYTDFRRIYRDAGGEGVLRWTDGADWQLTVYEPDFQTPDWIKDGTMYQIFPDRFCEGKPDKLMPFADRIYRADKTGEPYFWPTEQQEGYLNMDYYGGDFAGIQQKLPYLRDLGVSCIYLNPIFEAHANHRYNTANYLKADPLLGTNEEFSALCAAASKEGIRIILDGVFSHTGSDSVYFNREGRYGPGGAYRDRNSPYRSWYDFDSGYPSGYRCWWGFETLPEVQEDSPSYIDFVCGKGGVIDTWLGLGASGFRLDVADELPDAFIERIRQAVKAHGEDKLLIGEVWEDATTKEAFGQRRTYLRGKGLDAVMNYPFRNAALSFVTSGDAAAVAEQILTICENYPAPALNCAMNFLSTHDTERAITAIAGEPANGRDRYWQSGRRIPAEKMDDAMRKLLLGYAMIFTLPGVPCIYYGDEIAMQGYRDPFNRAFFDWNCTEQRLRGPLKTLAHLRKSCDAFDGGRLEIVRADGDVLHYRRIGKTQTAEIILNRGPHLLAEMAFGKYAEVNPGGFTVLVEENHPEHVGYFSIY
ncbi:MAG: glycoside hydrolase family 13 protein [Gemmiger sp.]|uniref:glycoside hydrolase family 13 protein n=1 Tax=Gemmiger sp. TaxID=2049027 RepID=UPI002A90DD4F|nr:glycoside hydrolase family 13 protein [Gemmiger sp.]MCI6143321.1 glycoside hydrolase family 13 protein [Subdoligranulum variabile]MDY5501167.1 glycoside hydrolase family 13 protein [Gemmiger sp.]